MPSGYTGRTQRECSQNSARLRWQFVLFWFFTEIMALGFCRLSSICRGAQTVSRCKLFPSGWLPVASNSPALDLHGVPGVSFECRINALRSISAPARDFHLRPQSRNYSTSCSYRKVTQENTQKEANREKKSVYSAHLRQTLMRVFCLVATDGTISNFTVLQKKNPRFPPHSSLLYSSI